MVSWSQETDTYRRPDLKSLPPALPLHGEFEDRRRLDEVDLVVALELPVVMVQRGICESPFIGGPEGQTP